MVSPLSRPYQRRRATVPSPSFAAGPPIEDTPPAAYAAVTVATFPIRRSRWALPFLVPLAPKRPAAAIEGDRLIVRMGLLGAADLPLSQIARVGTMEWPWWGGVGVRIARGLVAFVGASGPAAVIDLTEPVKVRAPLGWSTDRIAIGAEDVAGLVDAIAQARGVDVRRPPNEGAG